MSPISHKFINVVINNIFLNVNRNSPSSPAKEISSIFQLKVNDIRIFLKYPINKLSQSSNTNISHHNIQRKHLLIKINLNHIFYYLILVYNYNSGTSPPRVCPILYYYLNNNFKSSLSANTRL